MMVFLLVLFLEWILLLKINRRKASKYYFTFLNINHIYIISNEYCNVSTKKHKLLKRSTTHNPPQNDQQESQVASCNAVSPHCFLLFLICDILWCIISGVLRYLVFYLWCFVVYFCFLFVLSCAILLCLISCVLWYLVVSSL